MSEKLNNLSKEELINIITNLQMKLGGPESSFDVPDELKIDYCQLLESASDAIFVLDGSGKIIFMNSSWNKFIPDGLNITNGCSLAEHIAGPDSERARKLISGVLSAGKAVNNEVLRVPDSDGNTLYFNAAISPLKEPGGKIKGLLCVLKDNTEGELIKKKLADNTRMLENKVKELISQQEQLKSLRELNEDIINNTPLGIFILDITGIMLSENPALKKIMGHGKESRIGVNVVQYSGFVDSGLSALFERCLATAAPVQKQNVSYVPIARDRNLTIDVYMDPLLDEKGEVQRVVVMVEDRTEHAKMERIAKRAERNSSLGRLSQGIARELRKPIDKMYMDLNFVFNNVDKNSPALDYVVSLKDQLHRIKNLCEQLVALADPDEQEKEICEVNSVVLGHPIDILLARMKEKGYSVEVNMPEKSPRIKATRGQIVQVLFDLIENAQEAMPDSGKLTLAVATESARDADYAVITLADTGVGISEENMNRIFQPFYTTKGSEATGLGLMIASHVIDNLGGCMAVKSAPGQGTVFKIAIPVAENDQAGLNEQKRE